ncbi:histone H1 [Mucilaginibacter psychrotolerans]|uniref:Histone H1 n=1 Tax=Mucilaginibacter psychrotolerans TaxID=1524096 RepID=A0A4Y8SJS3_9SPHI|nr:histone H1 [Mucilaginibacter psychrotolerans]TFF38895.1 histone H1 [Mucilaginibacter psychrotolerans]
MSKYTDLKNLIAAIEPDAERFYKKGNHAAGTRLRTGLQHVKALAQVIRLEVQTLKTQTEKQ